MRPYAILADAPRSAVFVTAGREATRGRRGSAIVEFSVTLPVFVLILLGTIEATSMIFVKQGIKIAAYEAARVALVDGSELANVNLAANQILNGRNITGTTVNVTPGFNTASYGTPITVTVTADCASNSVIAPMFYVGRSMNTTVTMMRER